MNQFQKLTLQCVILLMSYTYALRLNTAASLIMAILCVLLSVEAHSPQLLVRRYPLIMALFLGIMGPLSCSALPHFLPVLPVLVLVSTIFAVLWMDSSVRVLRPAVKMMLYLYAGSLAVLLSGGREVFGIAGSLFPGHYGYYFIFLSLLFLPLPLVYAYKVTLRKRVRRYLRSSVKKSRCAGALCGQIGQDLVKSKHIS